MITDFQSEGTYLNVHKNSVELHTENVFIQKKHALFMLISQLIERFSLNCIGYIVSNAGAIAHLELRID
jgi:hypothetical protein